MIRQGYDYCMNCAKQSNERIFYFGELSLSVKLGSTFFGKPIITGVTGGSQKYKKTELVKGATEYTENKLPKRIEVRLTDDNGKTVTVSSAKRICPHCLADGNITPLAPDSGEADTYVISVVGPTFSGKSVWKNSALINKGQLELIRNFPDYRLYFPRCAKEDIVISATEIGSNGNEICDRIHVYEKKGSRLMAIILIRDTPGELFKESEVDTAEWHKQMNIFRKKGDYPGSDGIVFMVDDRAIEGIRCHYAKQDPTDPRTLPINAEAAEAVLSNMDSNTPIAAVITKADRIKKVVDEVGCLIGVDGSIVINRASIRQEKEPNRHSMQSDMAKNRYIVDQLIPFLRNSLCKFKSVGSFMVSSGEGWNDNHVDYTKGFGTVTPLLYLLNQLAVLKVKEGD